MADPHGFLKHPDRELPPRRPVPIRLMDWKEVQESAKGKMLHQQASRCMSCGIPFCHNGCPLGNLIPEWNDLVHRDDLIGASERLHATNNFPEFTGRLCPAPCEPACVLGINSQPVTIKSIEASIADAAWEANRVQPQPPDRLTGSTVAVIGSGPAGLACAQQLTRVGHTVVVYERDDAIGGLLRYGIPEFKMEKALLDRRIEQMQAEGTRFRPGVCIGGPGADDISGADLLDRFDAVVVAIGATEARDLLIPGREFAGIHQAMEYLPQANRACLGEDDANHINADGKNVVIIGGGDTGADCLGTALRQGAASVTQLEIMPRPSDHRIPSQPWPTFPVVFKMSSAHEEGGEREYAISTIEFQGSADGHVDGLKVTEVSWEGGSMSPIAGTERTIPADLVFLAMGFTGAEASLNGDLGLCASDSGKIDRSADYHSAGKVFVAGDAGRGQSLIVWAIAEGRACAAAVDQHLQGQTTLPRPVTAHTQSLRA